MEKNTRSKNILLAVLLIAILTLSTAYAALSQYLYINSQAVIGGASGWKVEFTYAHCVKTTLANGTNNAVVTHDFNDASAGVASLTGLNAKFQAPGDSITCDITISNNGTIPAKLSTFSLQDANTQITYTPAASGTAGTNDVTLVTGKLVYSIVYGTITGQGNTATGTAGSAPAANDTLPVGADQPLVLTISYPSTETEMPSDDVTIGNLKTTFLYVQN